MRRTTTCGAGRVSDSRHAMRRRSRVVPCLAAALLAGTVALAPGAAPATSGSPPAADVTTLAPRGLIAFSTGFILVNPDLESPSQVVTVRPDGSEERQLTHVPDGRQAGAPDISPDGTTIAYVSNEDADNFAVWTMNSDGTGQRRLFGRDGFDFFQPRWSPDGTHFVVTRCHVAFGFTDSCDLVLTKADGTDRHTLVGGGRLNGDASFSPDGRWIAFDSDRGGYLSTVWKVRADGGRPVRLTRPNLEAFWPSWSPDGSHLLISSNCCRPVSQVFTMRADGSHLRQLTHVTGADAAFASYSPDGRRIVFFSNQLRGPSFDRSDLFVMRADGSRAHRIVDDQPQAVGPDWELEGR